MLHLLQHDVLFCSFVFFPHSFEETAYGSPLNKMNYFITNHRNNFVLKNLKQRVDLLFLNVSISNVSTPLETQF